MGELEAVLDYYKIPYPQGRRYFMRKCLNPNHVEKEGSLRFNFEENYFNCFGHCGWAGPPFKLIALMENCSNKEAGRKFRKLMGGSSERTVSNDVSKPTRLEFRYHPVSGKPRA
jgi:hypothetical protein